MHELRKVKKNQKKCKEDLKNKDRNIQLKFSLLDLGYEQEDSNELGLCDMEDGSSLCLKCHKKFNTASQARIHYKEVHQVDKSQKNIFCPICRKGFSVKRYMANHMRSQHGVSQNMYKNHYIPNWKFKNMSQIRINQSITTKV